MVSEKLLFTKHLAVMLKSGVPLSQGVEIAINQSRNNQFKKCLEAVVASLNNGQSLVKSLALYPKVFDSLYRSIVAIGEQTGTLEKNLEYLASQLQAQYEFKKRVQSALLYPVLVVSISIVVGGGVAFFVLPKLLELFESLDVVLPLSTKILMFIAEVVKYQGLTILILLIGLVALFLVFIKSSFGKPIWHQIILRFPIWGPMKKYLELALISRNLGLMLSSGLPINLALKIASQSSGNIVFSRKLASLALALERGQSLHQELEKEAYAKVFPEMTKKMIGVGEATGKLDETLTYLGDFYERELDSMTKNISSVLEPILLVLIAAGVAFLAMAVISPIYQLTAGVKP